MKPKLVKLKKPVKSLSERYRKMGRPRKSDYDYTDSALPIKVGNKKMFIPVWER